MAPVDAPVSHANCCLLALPASALPDPQLRLVGLARRLPALFLRRPVEAGSLVFLCAGWLTLSVITPFYHPYARLWLPLEAFGWLFMGGPVCCGPLVRVEGAGRPASYAGNPEARSQILSLAAFAASRVCLQAGVFGLSRNGNLPGLLAPTDSLRLACRRSHDDLPTDLKNLRVLARPPVTFYLGQSASVLA